jgi:hypothetical protein
MVGAPAKAVGEVERRNLPFVHLFIAVRADVFLAGGFF